MAVWIVYVSNGYDYEYETEIEAKSRYLARKLWKMRGDHKTRDFYVSKKVN